MTSTDRPDTVNGWPVRWEARGEADNGRDVIGGMTAVIDAKRLERTPLLRVTIWSRESLYPVSPCDLDGQPVSAVARIARDLARDMLYAEILP